MCPQTDEGGKSYWSYTLIQQIRPGDLIFHYYTPDKAFIGASVAMGLAQPDKISWVPHGTAGRGKFEHEAARPAWRLIIGNYVAANDPLTLTDVQKDEAWVRNWIAQKQQAASMVAAPFQPYPGKLRGYQGYLTKMPLDFVHRWPKLQVLADQLSGHRYVEELAGELQNGDDLLTAAIEDVRHHRGQGFCVSPKARRAVEEFAMARAKQYCEAQGYNVEVLGKPYDLRCCTADTVLHVEVKGTSTTGDEILLTPNEVEFVNEHSSSMALFIVFGIQVSEGTQ